jgi:hypothetical protein
MEPLHLFSLVAIMGVLIAGIVLLRGDDYLVGINGLRSRSGDPESRNRAPGREIYAPCEYSDIKSIYEESGIFTNGNRIISDTDSRPAL